MELFATDLKALVDEGLGLDRPIICGLSLGGMIAQTYAVRYSDPLRVPVLADTAASAKLTLHDTLTRVAFPGWLMRGTVRVLDPSRYVDLAYWLAEVTRGKTGSGVTRTYVRMSVKLVISTITETILGRCPESSHWYPRYRQAF